MEHRVTVVLRFLYPSCSVISLLSGLDSRVSLWSISVINILFLIWFIVGMNSCGLYMVVFIFPVLIWYLLVGGCFVFQFSILFINSVFLNCGGLFHIFIFF